MGPSRLLVIPSPYRELRSIDDIHLYPDEAELRRHRLWSTRASNRMTSGPGALAAAAWAGQCWHAVSRVVSRPSGDRESTSCDCMSAATRHRLLTAAAAAAAEMAARRISNQQSVVMERCASCRTDTLGSAHNTSTTACTRIHHHSINPSSHTHTPAT